MNWIDHIQAEDFQREEQPSRRCGLWIIAAFCTGFWAFVAFGIATAGVNLGWWN